MATAFLKTEFPDNARTRQRPLERRAHNALEMAGAYCFGQLIPEGWADDQPRDILEVRFVDMFRTFFLKEEARRFAIAMDDSNKRDAKEVFITSGTYSPIVIGGHDGMPHYLKPVIKAMNDSFMMKGVVWPRTSKLRIEIYRNTIHVWVRDRSIPTDRSERRLRTKWCRPALETTT